MFKNTYQIIFCFFVYLGLDICPDLAIFLLYMGIMHMYNLYYFNFCFYALWWFSMWTGIQFICAFFMVSYTLLPSLQYNLPHLLFCQNMSQYQINYDMLPLNNMHHPESYIIKKEPVILSITKHFRYKEEYLYHQISC